MNNAALNISIADLEGPLERELSIRAGTLDLDPAEADIHLCVKVTRCGKDALVEGTVSSTFSIPCALCVEPAHIDINERLQLSLNIPSHGEINLTAPVRDAFMEGTPMKITCSPSCKGLCPACGKNMNNETCSCLERQTRQKGSLGVALDEALDRGEH
ncbi:DUF177 domain-containing protein [Planctomycetota bacterium]